MDCTHTRTDYRDQRRDDPCVSAGEGEVKAAKCGVVKRAHAGRENKGSAEVLHHHPRFACEMVKLTRPATSVTAL